MTPTPRLLALAASHLLTLALGFGLGVYLLPILTAPPAPSAQALQTQADQVRWTGVFRRNLKDSDALHWGEGQLAVGPRHISLLGQLAPGPDYKLYLSPEFVETEADFLRLKSQMVRVGDIKTFDNFLITVPEGVDPGRYTSAIVWCETFGQFITAAQYRQASD